MTQPCKKGRAVEPGRVRPLALRALAATREPGRQARVIRRWGRRLRGALSLRAALEPLLELDLILRYLLGRLPPRKRGEQLADAVALEVELEAHA